MNICANFQFVPFMTTFVTVWKQQKQLKTRNGHGGHFFETLQSINFTQLEVLKYNPFADSQLD